VGIDDLGSIGGSRLQLRIVPGGLYQIYDSNGGRVERDGVEEGRTEERVLAGWERYLQGERDQGVVQRLWINCVEGGTEFSSNFLHVSSTRSLSCPSSL
jgi:hypothetical protein